MRNYSIVIIALVTLISIATGCGNKNANVSTSSSTPATSTASASSPATSTSTSTASASATTTSKLLKEIASKKELVIGTSNEAPWSSVNTSGVAEGIIPDMLTQFLQYEKITAQIKPVTMPFGSLIPSIQSGRIQLIGDAMYRTAPREKEIDFTDILFYNPEALVVKKGNPQNIKSLTDLIGKTGGSYEGASYIDVLKNVKGADGSKINVKVYPTVQDVIADVESGRLAGALIDSSVAGYALLQNPKLNIQISTDYKAPDKAADCNALGIAKGADPEFLKEFNTWYAKAVSNGDMKKLFEKWGLAPSDYWLTL
jgi:polar amino acid transport system substrate-binding protein